MRSLKLLPALALAALAMGCGTKAQGPGLQIAGQLAAGIVSRTAGGAASAAAMDPRQTLTRDIIESAGQPLLLVVIPVRDAAASLTAAGQNGTATTWISEAGQTITLRDGLLVATRALGDDLMGMDAPGGLVAVRSGQPTRRTYEYLNGEDHIARMEVTCQSQGEGAETLEIYGRRIATQKILETCSFGGETFENSYWFQANGALTKSVQFVSFGIGSVEITQL